MSLTDLQRKYRDLIGQAEIIRDDNRHNDTWPAEDAVRFDRIMDEAETLQEQMDREKRFETQTAWGSEIASPLPFPGETKELRHRSQEVKAFDQWLRSGGPIPTEYKAALAEGATTTGGYAVPTILSGELIKAIVDAGVILRLARRVQMSSWKMEVATLTATTAAVLTTEAGAYDEKEPTFGQVAFEAYKFSRLAKSSDEMLADSLFDVWGNILSPDFAQAFALALDNYGTVGTGTSQPAGVVTGATVGKTAASQTAITADEVIDLCYALGHQYRGRATWMANDQTIKAIRQLKDTTNQYLWQPGLQAGQPDLVLGRPIVVNNQMATMAASAKTLLFGDFSYFWVGMREELTVKRLDELYAADGQVGFRAYQRWDSHVMLAAAIQVLQQAA